MEWLSLSSWALFLSSWSIFVALFFVLLFVFRKKQHLSFTTLTLFLQSAAFLLIHMKYARGVDQFVPFAILLCASAFSDLKIHLRVSHRLAASVALICTIGVNMYIALDTLDDQRRIDNSKAALWLKEHTPAKSEVFITNYGAFPELFFYNTHNVYTFGFDAVFLKEHDQRLYDRYLAVLQLSADPYPIIKQDFGASYVHIENLPQTQELYRYLLSDPTKFIRVYQDTYAAVFKVI
jgi:hypothetical protein